MTREKKAVLVIIAGFIALSVYSWFPVPEAKDIVRLLLNCVLCWFLYKGVNWSRWIMAVLSLLASGVAAIAVINLSNLTVASLGLVVMLVFYSVSAYILISQKFIKKHFSR